MPAKKSGLDALGFTPLDLPVAPEPPAVSPLPTPARSPSKRPKRDRKMPDKKQHTVYLPNKLHRALKGIAAEEDKKVHDLFLEGLDTVLRKRGMGRVASFTKPKDE